MPRAKAVAAAGRHRNLAGQQPVLVAEHLQRTRLLGLAGGGVMAARDQNRQPVVEADPHLMPVDAGVDRLALRDLGAGRDVGIDPIDLEAARIAERHQQVARRNVARHVDRPGRQRDRRPVRRQRAGRRIDAQCADMVLVADNAADARGAVARRDIEILPRGVRPSVMDIGRQGDGGAPRQGRIVDIDFVMRQLRPDARVEHHVFRACPTSPRGNWKYPVGSISGAAARSKRHRPNALARSRRRRIRAVGGMNWPAERTAGQTAARLALLCAGSP